MVFSRLQDKAKELGSLIGIQRGFTLVELVAVMARMAILVAVVAPAVTETRDASIKAQAQTDAKQVSNLAADYFSDQTEAETRTPHTTAVGAIGAAAVAANKQFISSRWPEQFITNSGVITGGYEVEFEAVAPALKAVSVTLLEENNSTAVSAADFLSYTAVDFSVLGGDAPSSESLTTTVEGISVHNFLWLFSKGDSDSGLPGDLRTVTVFQLTGTEIIEGAGDVNLTYKRVL